MRLFGSNGAGEDPQVSRRGLLTGLAGVGLAAGVAGVGLAAGGPGVPAIAAGAKKILWYKGNNQVHLYEGTSVVRVMLCADNDAKTPAGTYAIKSWGRTTSYVNGRLVYLENWGPFYRRPGATWDIGFHSIPTWASGSGAGRETRPMSDLGVASDTGGCVNLSRADSSFLRSWAPVGTPVVVKDGSAGSSTVTTPTTTTPTTTTPTTPVYVPPPFPTGLAPNRSTPSAIRLQNQLKKAGFLAKSVVVCDYYGDATQRAVAAFHNKHTQFRSSTYDVKIGPKGWAFLHTNYQ